jgi:hypothetical protein
MKIFWVSGQKKPKPNKQKVIKAECERCEHLCDQFNYLIFRPFIVIVRHYIDLVSEIHYLWKINSIYRRETEGSAGGI